ncbi:uncharacterized protein DUF397 [Lentzea atacamensis]|uniref:Uncharacterized protein DUF397 n=1 Tax=Lentzea atacamensis TaxID=531938 RepID=A0A316HP10_9PSEU|nr:DUF397 domain-containing protein [Lentzea atacamensis]PWK81748.1 uncharacterized protein DUF397 [Lentzea atacamensis]
MEGKWRKSTYSNGGEANCVELVFEAAVRDSKNTAVVIGLSPASWSAFVAASKRDSFR